LKNKGVPPTPLNARTGELTPPGINLLASVKRYSDFGNLLLITIKSL
jgi:hypothetical protein